MLLWLADHVLRLQLLQQCPTATQQMGTRTQLQAFAAAAAVELPPLLQLAPAHCLHLAGVSEALVLLLLLQGVHRAAHVPLRLAAQASAFGAIHQNPLLGHHYHLLLVMLPPMLVFLLLLPHGVRSLLHLHGMQLTA